MKNIKQIALTAMAALTVAASLGAAQTASTSTITPATLTPSSVAKNAAINLSNVATTAEQKVATKVTTGEQKVTTASQRLHLTYLDYLNQIPKTSRAKYQKIAKNSGLDKAIAAMKKALGKPVSPTT
jgi:O6-methylguanine-DNA--protein-cysteine methyltransferase